MYAGTAPAISLKSIYMIDFIIRKPTITSAGAVAKPGIARKIGAASSDSKKQNAQHTADKPVLAPALMPTADSANVVVVLVPRTAPAKVAIESASRILFNRGIVPSLSINGVPATAPFTVPTVSKKSVKRNAKHITAKSADSKSCKPDTSEPLYDHWSISKAEPNIWQNS